MVPSFERRSPRFEARTRVQVRFENRASLEELWVKNVSKTGLFVETAEPPDVGSNVDVRVETPDAAGVLRGTVVHVIDVPRSVDIGHPPGAGVKFVDLAPEKQDLLNIYTDDIARFGGELLAGGEDAVGAVLSSARLVAERLSESDLYGALDVGSETMADTIQQRVQELRDLFRGPPSGLSSDQSERLQAIAAHIDRIGVFLADEHRRLRYDFKTGYVRANERLAEAEIEGRETKFLQDAWAASYPHSFERAERLAHTAFVLSMTGDYELAFGPAREALELDPFNVKLRDALREWQEQVGF